MDPRNRGNVAVAAVATVGVLGIGLALWRAVSVLTELTGIFTVR